MDQMIFKPLGMTHTFVLDFDSIKKEKLFSIKAIKQVHRNPILLFWDFDKDKKKLLPAPRTGINLDKATGDKHVPTVLVEI